MSETRANPQRVRKGIGSSPAATGDQPRPALGRRPWFAFERRARSLRRFFLAIAATRVTAHGALVAGDVRLRAGDWESPPLIVARRAGDRRRGLRPRAAGRALLIAGSSAHAFGMAEPLRVVGIGADGRILSSRWLAPSRVVWISGSRWMLELPVTHPIPPQGVVVSGVASTLA